MIIIIDTPILFLISTFNTLFKRISIEYLSLRKLYIIIVF